MRNLPWTLFFSHLCYPCIHRNSSWVSSLYSRHKVVLLDPIFSWILFHALEWYKYNKGSTRKSIKLSLLGRRSVLLNHRLFWNLRDSRPCQCQTGNIILHNFPQSFPFKIHWSTTWTTSGRPILLKYFQLWNILWNIFNSPQATLWCTVTPARARSHNSIVLLLLSSW